MLAFERTGKFRDVKEGFVLEYTSELTDVKKARAPGSPSSATSSSASSRNSCWILALRLAFERNSQL
jgi:hypothetical protein